jgi:hypothetical protein
VLTKLTGSAGTCVETNSAMSNTPSPGEAYPAVTLGGRPTTQSASGSPAETCAAPRAAAQVPGIVPARRRPVADQLQRPLSTGLDRVRIERVECACGPDSDQRPSLSDFAQPDGQAYARVRRLVVDLGGPAKPSEKRKPMLFYVGVASGLGSDLRFRFGTS